MRAVRPFLIFAFLIGLPVVPALAQAPERYSSNEILDTGHRFFGSVSRGLASVVERAFSTWGQPNGYVLGQEGGGADSPRQRAREDEEPQPLSPPPDSRQQERWGHSALVAHVTSPASAFPSSLP